jgi:phthalate 4,5-dioxygenase
MLTRQENEMLCRVGPDTPMGRMMRRYWVPIAMSTELADGTPKRVRVLGEDFVAFRGADGVAAMLDELCPHRGASLVLARTEGCALRCLYHGWKIDRAGAIVEMPSEPEGSVFANKVRHPSYPVYEAAGIVWTYLGAPATAPPVPDFAYSHYPESHRINDKHRVDCNWVQSLEGAIDTAHSNYLHSTDISFAKGEAEGSRWTLARTERPSNDGQPKILTEDTPYGFRYAAIRRPVADAQRQRYVRVTHFVAPFTAIIPLGDLQNVQIFVPIDDTHTYMYNVKFGFEERPPGVAAGRRQDDQVDGDFGTLRRRENNWLQDREAMKTGSYTGIEVIRNQDRAVQESMGPIYDRTKEHLGVSDTAIIRMRRRMLDSVRAFAENGALPLGIAEPFDYRDVVAVEGMLPIDAPWQNLLRSGTVV